MEGNISLKKSLKDTEQYQNLQKVILYFDTSIKRHICKYNKHLHAGLPEEPAAASPVSGVMLL